MESRSAKAVSTTSSSESVQSASRSDDVFSDGQSSEIDKNERKGKKRNFTQPEGIIKRTIALTPSSDDPDINALFQSTISEVDGQRVFKCIKCGKEDTRPYSARRHAKVHLKDGATCGICLLHLSGPLSLALHQKTKHNGQKKVVVSRMKKNSKPSSPVTTTRNTRTSRDAAASASHFLPNEDILSSRKTTKRQSSDKSLIEEDAADAARKKKVDKTEPSTSKKSLRRKVIDDDEDEVARNDEATAKEDSGKKPTKRKMFDVNANEVANKKEGEAEAAAKPDKREDTEASTNKSARNEEGIVEVTNEDAGAVEVAAQEKAAETDGKHPGRMGKMKEKGGDERRNAGGGGEETTALCDGAESSTTSSTLQTKRKMNDEVEVAKQGGVLNEKKGEEMGAGGALDDAAEAVTRGDVMPEQGVDTVAEKQSDTVDEKEADTVDDMQSDTVAEREANTVEASATLVEGPRDKGDVVEDAWNEPFEELAVKEVARREEYEVKRNDSEDVITVVAREEVAEVRAGSKPLPQHTLHERRSSRIQMRLAMEASAMEEEKRRPRRDALPPPIYPSNSEKMRETRALTRRAMSLGPPALRLQQVAQPDILVDAVVPVASARAASMIRPTRTAGSATARASSSRESVLSTSTTSVRSATTVPRRHQLLLPGAAPRTTSHEPAAAPHLPPITSPGMAYQSTGAAASAAAAVEPPRYMNGAGGNSNAHYPRLSSVFGSRVYQQQPVVSAPARWLFPAPLSTALLSTIYHPAWLRPTGQMGADEMEAVARFGHAHLLLPARMHRTETMMEKCLKAVQDTAMPLPPLQPLLPDSLLGDGYSDPLTDVLESLPNLPSHPVSAPAVPVHTQAEAKYTTACEAARYQVWTTRKSEDRKWWEVRTFPSLHGLTMAGPAHPLPTSVRPTTGPTPATYAMADRSARRHAAKYTYVTSKKPIFSVHDSSSRPWLSTPASTSYRNRLAATTRASSIAARSVIDTGEILPTGRLPSMSGRLPPSNASASGRPLPSRASSVPARPIKRGPGSEVPAALMKRLKAAGYEMVPTGQPAATQLRQLQGLQQQLDADVVHVGDYCASTIRHEEVTVVEEDGTTFTVL